MFHMKQSLTPKQKDKIEAYILLLKTYNETTNIYSKKAYDKLDFHVADCINIAELCENKHQSITDLGSGSGLPSIIVAICCPNSTITALESKSRKTTFLVQAKATLDLNNYNVINQNIPEWIHHSQPQTDIITAKAFAPFKDCVSTAKRIAKKGAKLIVPISFNQYQEVKPLPKNTSYISDETLQTGYLTTYF